MSVNKYLPHVYLIPEDDADRQIADGFTQYTRVANKIAKMSTDDVMKALVRAAIITKTGKLTKNYRDK